MTVRKLIVPLDLQFLLLTTFKHVFQEEVVILNLSFWASRKIPIT